eukprot:2794329-Ditylum_brightwellii.AAC.1
MQALSAARNAPNPNNAKGISPMPNTAPRLPSAQYPPASVVKPAHNETSEKQFLSPASTSHVGESAATQQPTI